MLLVGIVMLNLLSNGQITSIVCYVDGRYSDVSDPFAAYNRDGGAECETQRDRGNL